MGPYGQLAVGENCGKALKITQHVSKFTQKNIFLFIVLIVFLHIYGFWEHVKRCLSELVNRIVFSAHILFSS